MSRRARGAGADADGAESVPGAGVRTSRIRTGGRSRT